MFSSETDIGQNEKPIYNLERIELSDDPITLRTRYLQPSPRFSFATVLSRLKCFFLQLTR